MGKEIFVDANIFLEIFLKDSKSEECKKFLKYLQIREDKVFTNDFVIYASLLVVQSNLKSPEAIQDAILFFNNYPNLKILRPSFDDIYSAIEIMQIDNLDFDDSLVVACMKNYGIDKLASFDRHFDRVHGIKRIVF